MQIIIESFRNINIYIIILWNFQKEHRISINRLVKVIICIILWWHRLVLVYIIFITILFHLYCCIAYQLYLRFFVLSIYFYLNLMYFSKFKIKIKRLIFSFVCSKWIIFIINEFYVVKLYNATTIISLKIGEINIDFIAWILKK